MLTLEEGLVIAGKYRLEYALARGGMGSVWVARHAQLDVMVAVKFMAPELAASADARARFEREAKASAQLKSPNVVQVHDYGIEDGTPYIVMELLEGEDLEDLLERAGRLPLAAAAGIVQQACKALRLAHAASLVHRDLKPGNLFLAKSGDDEVVKVLDFGIAKATTTELAGKGTKTGSLIGSPHYMSPEQVRNSKQVDHRSDLWSMGIIVFRMITGRLPFPGDEVGEILVDICTAPIPAASEVAPALGSEVDPFFRRALARDPAQRFQSARELSDALAALAGIDTGARGSLVPMDAAALGSASSRSPSQSSLAGLAATLPGDGAVQSSPTYAEAQRASAPAPASGPAQPVAVPAPPAQLVPSLPSAPGLAEPQVPVPAPRRSGRRRAIVGAAALAAMLGIGGIVAATRLGATTASGWSDAASPVPVSSDDPTWGSRSAPVTLVVFGDLQCPHTAQLGHALGGLKDRYGWKKIRIVWKHDAMPIHKDARPAAIAAETVFRAGGPKAFWNFSDLALANRDDLTAQAFERWARQSGVDVKSYRSSLWERRHAAKVDADAALAASLGVSGTPTTFINGLKVSGALPIEKLVPIIDQQIKAADAELARGAAADTIYVSLSTQNRGKTAP